MTPKQQRFVAEYLVDLVGGQAAIRAGYSPRGADAQAARLLRDVKIKAAVERGMAERAVRTEITADRVLKELARVAFLDIRKAFRPDGSLKPIDQMDDDTAAAIAGLEVREIMNGDGETVGRVKKVRLADKIAALEKIGRHLGMFSDKLILKGDAESPLTVLVKQLQGSAIKPVEIVPEEEPLALHGPH